MFKGVGSASRCFKVLGRRLKSRELCTFITSCRQLMYRNRILIISIIFTLLLKREHFTFRNSLKLYFLRIESLERCEAGLESAANRPFRISPQNTNSTSHHHQYCRFKRHLQLLMFPNGVKLLFTLDKVDGNIYNY